MYKAADSYRSVAYYNIPHFPAPETQGGRDLVRRGFFILQKGGELDWR